MNAVCERIANGALLNESCAAAGVSARTIREWSRLDEFAPQYARAREAQAHAVADEAMRLADAAVGMTGEGVQARRLQVDTRKWLASKLAPRHYGDRVDVTSDDRPLAAPQTWIWGDKAVTF